MMRKRYVWGIVGIVLFGALLAISKDVRERVWTGLDVAGISAGLFSSRRVTAQAETVPRQRRGKPPIDLAVPAVQQTATFALG